MKKIARVERGGFRYYLAANHQMPSVTTVLEWTYKRGLWRQAWKDKPGTIYAGELGTGVHEACADLARRIDELTGTPDQDVRGYPMEVAPYARQFHAFLFETGWRPDSLTLALGAPKETTVEMTIYSLKRKYAGTLDLVGRFPGRPNLIDIKSGSPEAWLTGFQTAAYLEAFRELTGDLTARSRAMLILKHDRYRLVELSEPDDLSYFLSALNCFRAADRYNSL